MELETAMAKAFDDISTHLTPQIITGEGNTFTASGTTWTESQPTFMAQML